MAKLTTAEFIIATLLQPALESCQLLLVWILWITTTQIIMEQNLQSTSKRLKLQKQMNHLTKLASLAPLMRNIKRANLQVTAQQMPMRLCIIQQTKAVINQKHQWAKQRLKQKHQHLAAHLLQQQANCLATKIMLVWGLTLSLAAVQSIWLQK